MVPPNDRNSVWRHWRWAVWLVCLAVWTVALLRPEPAAFQRDVVEPVIRLPVGKFVHVGVYAFLVGLGGTLPLGGKRWLVLVVLSAHALITEYLQTFVPLRHGSWVDVGLDHFGMALGLVITWRYWVPG